MTLANLILWLALAINITLLIYVGLNKKQQQRVPLFVLIFLITLWEVIELTNVFWLRGTDHLLLGARFGLLPNLFLAPAFVWLVFSLFGLWKNLVAWKKNALFLPAIVAIPFLFTAYNVKSVTLTESGFVFEQGYLYWFFSIYFAALLIFALSFLLKNRRQANLVIKKQIDYIFFGTAITAILGLLFSVILPLINIKSLFYIGVDSSVFFTIVLVYALSHDRFLDLKLSFSKSAIDLLTLFIVLVIYYLIFWLLLNFIDLDFKNVLDQILFVLFIGLTSPWLYKFLFRLVNLLFFNPNQKIKQAELSIAEILRSTRDLNTLFSQLAKEISQVISYREIFVYLAKHNNHEVFHQVFPVGERLLNLNDSQLLQFLASQSKLIHQAELDYWQEDKYLAVALQKQQIDLALPIFYNQQLLGVLIIDHGQKLLSRQQLQFMENIQKYLDIAVGSLLLANK
ncbi:GAF domain-containing protein [Candidatus Nomurabacteria bacterium]|nr:GAF domain-containing protein [Candidatus Nomurabacteria bacterium]